MRGERVLALEVDLFDGLEGQRRQIDVTPAGQLVEQALEILRWRLAQATAIALLRGQHQQVLGAGEGGIEQPPEIEVLDVLQRLEAGFRQVPAIFQQLVERGVLLARHRLQRAAHHHRELQPLGLVDGQERDAALGRVLGLILVLADTALLQEAQELVEQVTEVLFQEVRVQHADEMQVLELGEQLGESAKIARRAALVHALHRLLREEARKERELQELVEQTREGVVGVLREHGVALGQRAGPIQQGLVFRLAQLVDEGLEALVVVVVPDVQMHAVGPRPHLGELREQENQRADHQADLLPLEKHVRAGENTGTPCDSRKRASATTLSFLTERKRKATWFQSAS